jgi:hypothetical protein
MATTTQDLKRIEAARRDIIGLQLRKGLSDADLIDAFGLILSELGDEPALANPTRRQPAEALDLAAAACLAAAVELQKEANR